MTSNESVHLNETASNNTDDESDSSFLLRRRAAPIRLDDEHDENQLPCYHRNPNPPVIIRRRDVNPPTVRLISSPSPTSSRIAKIVDSLLLKQQPTPQKQRQKSYDRSLLLSNLSKLETESCFDDDLTDLSQLVGFSLTSIPGFSPLSPPISPTTKTSEVLVRSTGGNDEDEGDEADSASHCLIKRPELDAQTSNSTFVMNVRRPPISFCCLAFLAIESSQRKRLSVKVRFLNNFFIRFFWINN